MKNNWHPDYYRKLRGHEKRIAYLKHLISLGYTKTIGPCGIAMVPPSDRFVKNVDEASKAVERIYTPDWYPYKDN